MKGAYFPWNGSKRWLEPLLRQAFAQWDGCGRFIDPFCGSGAPSRICRDLFPDAPQILSDANPWLTALYELQVRGQPLPIPPSLEPGPWRALRDADLPSLTRGDRAARFLICLLTAWGNRWECRDDGTFRSTLNPKFCDASTLAARIQQVARARWLGPMDQARAADVAEALRVARPGDLVYLDPPYPETLGYGNQVWNLDNQLDLIDWAAAHQEISVVFSNASPLRRLLERAGLRCQAVVVPSSTRTKRQRSEVVAWRAGPHPQPPALQPQAQDHEPPRRQRPQQAVA